MSDFAKVLEEGPGLSGMGGVIVGYGGRGGESSEEKVDMGGVGRDGGEGRRGNAHGSVGVWECGCQRFSPVSNQSRRVLGRARISFAKFLAVG